MTRKRSLSLAGLRAFVAAARLLSFTKAAAELHLSQPALSRQVQGLEEELGLALFVRGTRKLTLTAAGEALWRATTAGLRQIDECVVALRSGTERRQVVVSTFASFASLWLIPRLSRFSSVHSDVDVHCLAHDRLVDLDVDGIDVALRAARSGLEGDGAQMLFEEWGLPVASPALAASPTAPLRTPEDLRSHTLLAFDEEDERIHPWTSWSHWFEAQGVAEPPRSRAVLRFTNHDQIVQAALAGQGVALGRSALVADLLEEGRLVAPLGPGVRSPASYYVVAGRAASQRPEVQAFVTWIRQEAEGSAAARAALERAPRAGRSRRTRASSAKRV